MHPHFVKDCINVEAVRVLWSGYLLACQVSSNYLLPFCICVHDDHRNKIWSKTTTLWFCANDQIVLREFQKRTTSKIAPYQMLTGRRQSEVGSLPRCSSQVIESDSRWPWLGFWAFGLVMVITTNIIFSLNKSKAKINKQDKRRQQTAWQWHCDRKGVLSIII